VHEAVETRSTSTTVEIFHRGQRVAAHPRGRVRGGHTTDRSHMPKSHRDHSEWSPSRILNWAASIGPRTEELAAAILKNRPHPEMGYRSCLGIVRLERTYGGERLEAACGRALALGATSYRHVASTLKNRMEQASLPMSEAPAEEIRDHENLPRYAQLLWIAVRRSGGVLRLITLALGELAVNKSSAASDQREEMRAVQAPPSRLRHVA